MLVNKSHAHDDEDANTAGPSGQGYVLHNRKGRTLQPLSKDLKPAVPHARPIDAQQHYPAATAGFAGNHGQQPASTAAFSTVHNKQADDAKTPDVKKSHSEAAVNLIRQKVAALYTDEPDVKTELQQNFTPALHPSKHQQFMHQLSSSGKPLAQIQTEWHSYYLSLTDTEKHEVWQEFYQANGTPGVVSQPVIAKDNQESITPTKKTAKRVLRDYIPNKNYAARHGLKGIKPPKKLQKQIIEKIQLSVTAQAKAKQHFQSLLFGISTGIVVLIIFLFGFFNEMFIAPFIQPSRHASATPIILSQDSIGASETPEVIIPKINVQIPVVYGETSVAEVDVQAALEKGIIHYPTTVLPGQQGNAAFFGHSSNNIFNKGKYKFAFVLLRELVPGDIFYITYNKTVYSYRVFNKKVVPPTEMSVLNNVPNKAATAALITCDPPGTSTNRLVVWGEQISPDPSGATAPAVTPPTGEQTSGPTELPSEGPTMWNRFWNWVF